MICARHIDQFADRGRGSIGLDWGEEGDQERISGYCLGRKDERRTTQLGEIEILVTSMVNDEAGEPVLRLNQQKLEKRVAGMFLISLSITALGRAEHHDAIANAKIKCNLPEQIILSSIHPSRRTKTLEATVSINK